MVVIALTTRKGVSQEGEIHNDFASMMHWFVSLHAIYAVQTFNFKRALGKNDPTLFI